jgi:hypothetical protein
MWWVEILKIPVGLKWYSIFSEACFKKEIALKN